MSLITPSGGLLFWMALIFAIMFFILAKFGFPVITAMVKKRRDYISCSLEDAAKAQEEAAQARRSCDSMLDEVRVRQADMLEEARIASEKLMEETRTAAAEERKKLLDKTRQDIEQLKKDAREDIRNEVVATSVAISEKILRGRLETSEAQMTLIDKMIEEIHRDEQRDNS